MSLTVPPELLEQAQVGPVDHDDFVDCIEHSLPYAWSVVTELAERLAIHGEAFADSQTEPPDEQAHAQLLRLVSSDAMRAAIERHFGVKVAFQSCHRLALFHPGATAEYEEFVSARAQILNQRPDLVRC